MVVAQQEAEVVEQLILEEVQGNLADKELQVA
jgi:hypothetical protein